MAFIVYNIGALQVAFYVIQQREDDNIIIIV
jgi:hypothetical protein